jgi:hypothetical protein
VADNDTANTQQRRGGGKVRLVILTKKILIQIGRTLLILGQFQLGLPD